MVSLCGIWFDNVTIHRASETFTFRISFNMSSYFQLLLMTACWEGMLLSYWCQYPRHNIEIIPVFLVCSGHHLDHKNRWGVKEGRHGGKDVTRRKPKKRKAKATCLWVFCFSVLDSYTSFSIVGLSLYTPYTTPKSCTIVALWRHLWLPSPREKDGRRRDGWYHFTHITSASIHASFVSLMILVCIILISNLFW